MREQALLAILDAGPIVPADLATLSRWHRKRAQDGIDTLIAALDALQGDPDLEDGNDDEQTLGWHESGSGVQAINSLQLFDEAEPEEDFEAVNEDGDPLDMGEGDEAEVDSRECAFA